MRFMSFVAVIVLVVVSGNKVESAAGANGLGDHFEWTDWGLAQEKSFKEGKPLMVILHKTWCPACKKLKEWFGGSRDIFGLSEGFVMVNANEEQDPQGHQKFDVDGTYIPRIFFLSPGGEILDDISNDSGNPNYKYFYFDEDSVVKSMKKALERIGAEKVATDHEEL